MPQRKERPAKASRSKVRKGPKQASSLTLSDLDQVKVLADPLRLRILEELCAAERTTKQVAERIGEKPTKLYHHMEALERVGLIRLARTRQNRGTMEKYYMAVARQFRAELRTADDSQAGGDAVQAMISTMFGRTAEELLSLISQGQGREGIEEKGVLSYLEIRTDAAEGHRIQSQLMKLIKSLEGGNTRGGKRYRLTLAFYPLEPDE
ncbi:MAG TPA: helix-turn-helix domain-containing protein [Candidatus Eisenbacteria bacterium]|nr:helix-turn-helix domain-containing protein [Candidatus Eisenbacteria bacterium]